MNFSSEFTAPGCSSELHPEIKGTKIPVSVHSDRIAYTLLGNMSLQP